MRDLWNAVNTLCFDFAVYVPDNSPAVLDVKETVLRYALASVELTFMEAQVSPTSRMEGRGREHPKSRPANGREGLTDGPRSRSTAGRARSARRTASTPGTTSSSR